MRSVRNAKDEILAFLNAKKEKMGVDSIHDLIPKESAEEWRFVRVNRCKTTVDKVIRILSGGCLGSITSQRSAVRPMSIATS